MLQAKMLLHINIIVESQCILEPSFAIPSHNSLVYAYVCMCVCGGGGGGGAPGG